MTERKQTRKAIQFFKLEKWIKVAKRKQICNTILEVRKYSSCLSHTFCGAIIFGGTQFSFRKNIVILLVWDYLFTSLKTGSAKLNRTWKECHKSIKYKFLDKDTSAQSSRTNKNALVWQKSLKESKRMVSEEIHVIYFIKAYQKTISDFYYRPHFPTEQCTWHKYLKDTKWNQLFLWDFWVMFENLKQIELWNCHLENLQRAMLLTMETYTQFS